MCESAEKMFLLLSLLTLVLAAPCPAQRGPVICWGDYARDGHNPVPGNNYVAVCAGGYHGRALTADGTLVTWGENIRGQCNAPRGGGFTAIAAGLYHSLAMRGHPATPAGAVAEAVTPEHAETNGNITTPATRTAGASPSPTTGADVRTDSLSPDFPDDASISI
jgi:hypothetical protein